MKLPISMSIKKYYYQKVTSKVYMGHIENNNR